MITVPPAAVVVAPVARPFAPFAVAAVDNFEVGAAATIDPDPVAVVTPSAVEDAVGLTALAHDEDTVARVGGAEIALHVIGWAVDEGRGFRLPVAGNAEVRSAATIGPDSALAIAPSLAFDAGGLATLANQVHAETRIRGAPNALHIVGGAIDHVGVAKPTELVVAVTEFALTAVVVAIRIMAPVVVTATLDHHGGLNGYLELGAAAMVNPDSVLVVAPTAVLDALGFALLVDHLNAAGGIRCAHVAAHIVRSARHA